MVVEKQVALTLKMTEAQADKLAEIAGERGVTMEQCVIDLIEADSKSSDISNSLAQLERLSWMNLYWTTLPFSDGLPKQRLNEEGLEQLWDNAAAFADKFARVSQS